MFADHWSGQNRYHFVPYMLVFKNSRLGSYKLAITFLEKGHTETENDSVHSVIDCAARTAQIYMPEQWNVTVRSARKSKTPYIVQEMSVTEFTDLKKMAKTVKDMSVDVDGEKVKWSLVKQFIAYSHDKDALYVTYDYNKPEKRIDEATHVTRQGNQTRDKLLQSTSKDDLASLK